LAVRWKLVELEGEAVCVPLAGTSPTPSMVTTVAPVVRQLRTTDWPRSIATGSAVRVAVGAAAGVAGMGPRVLGFTALSFLWQPVTAPRAAAKATIVRALRRLACETFIGNLLLLCLVNQCFCLRE